MEGDQNSKLLHSLYKPRENKAIITELHTQEGRVLVEHEAIKHHLYESFKKRFESKETIYDLKLLHALPIMFSEVSNEVLKTMPSMQEIENAVHIALPGWMDSTVPFSIIDSLY